MVSSIDEPKYLVNLSSEKEANSYSKSEISLNCVKQVNAANCNSN